jgi:hypothetical protein
LQNKIEKKKKEEEEKERRIGDSHLQKLRNLGEGSWEWSHWLFLLLLLHYHLWRP